MNKRLSKIVSLFAIYCLAFSVTAGSAKQTAQKETRQQTNYDSIQWVELLPEKDLIALTEGAIPDNVMEGSAEDEISSAITMTITDPSKPLSEYERALRSSIVRSEFDNGKIRLPGFIVPVDMKESGEAISFFFVPFFGACIHLPPPPPNQIIYATYEKGIEMDDLNTPFWIEGTIYTKQIENDIALAAYSVKVDTLYEYKDTDEY